VTGSLSIFLKICPACAAQVPTDADQCSCGHDFETAVSNAAPEESALRDEELYENYLMARSEQAHQAAESARLSAAEDPEDANKAAEAELASEVARSIDADLREQQTKINALRRLVEVKRPKSVVVSAPVQKAMPVEHKPQKNRVEAPKPEASASRKEKSRRADVQIVAAPVSPAKPEPEVIAPVIASPAASAEKAAQVLSAIKRAKIREDETRARKALESARQSVPESPAEPSPPKASDIDISMNPPDSFRQEQCARADLLMDTRKLDERKECPNCTASVPMNTTRCSCGFAFVSSSNDMPSLTLCTGDFTALRNSLNLHLRRS